MMDATKLAIITRQTRPNFRSSRVWHPAVSLSYLPTKNSLFCLSYGNIGAPQVGRAVAVSLMVKSRKVRTPQGTVPDNIRRGAISWIGPQKQTASPHTLRAGKGEMVV